MARDVQRSKAAGLRAAWSAGEREMARVPLRVREGHGISLAPGGRNALVTKIIEEFCPRFTPGANALYVGGAGAKSGYVDKAALKALRIGVNAHAKLPSVVVHDGARNWLVVIEAATTHGPVNAKRRSELKTLFAASTAALVYVSAFLSRQGMHEHLREIAWKTDVWVADAPSHMIHFNGERFLGPHE